MSRPDDHIEHAGSGPIAWMVRNPVASNLAMIVLLAGGLFMAFNIRKEVFPDFELGMVSISVPYPGASPEEVEKGIVLVIEEAVRGLDGVDEVNSVAQEGVGIVQVELLEGADEQRVHQEIKQEVDRITTFPEEAEEPQVNLISRRRGVISIIVYGSPSEWVLREISEQLRERLLQDPEITQVDLSGVRPYEVTIAVSRTKLREYGLTLPGIADLIRRSALELPGGGVKTEGGEILVRVRDRRYFADEFLDIPIVSNDKGGQIFLRDIATVSDGFEDVDRIATYNGQTAVRLDVFRIGDQTPVQVSDAARRLVEQFQTELPPGVSVDLLDDRSDMYRQRINLLLKNGRIGLVLVLILLGLFLEARLAFWVMMGIPISFLGGLLFLPSLGVTINMMSMFAFLIALGIVVDDAIVVGENVYEHHQQGMPFLKAAIVGTQEVAVPVTFSILTNLVTFFPLMVVPGVIGKIWRNIPMVVVTVFIISLLECMFILPSHLGHSGERGPRTRFGRGLHRQQQRFSRFFMHWVQNSYGPFLRKTLDHRYLTVSVGLGVLIVIIGCVKSARVGMIPFPRTEADASVVTAVLPYGTALSKSEQVRDRLVTSAQRVAERHGGKAQALGVFAEVGGAFRGVSGGHVVEVRAYMSDVDSRPVTTTEFTREWREEAGEIPGLEAIIFEADRGGPGSGAGLTLELSHPDSQTLELACSDLAVALEDYPTVSDIDDGYSPGKRQFDFRIRPETLNLGLTARDIALQMRGAFYGSEALRQQRGRNEVKVKVRLPEEERVSEQDINELLIRTPAGVDVPLREVAAIERGRAYTRIERRDGRRILNVSANVTPEYEAERIMEELRADTLPRLKERYPGLSFSFEGRQEFFREALQSLARGFLIAILVIYAMLAIPFGSYIQPLVVMICIPFGIVGAVIGHMLMGFPLSVVSMMGIVALAGVVVNDSLVLIDYANRQRDLGISMREAVHLAGVRRFRPILLTTLTTFFGLAPMIFETSRQARFMIPMAISLGYGILFATLITLVLVPSLVVIIEDFKHAGRAVADVVTPGDADAATGPEF